MGTLFLLAVVASLICLYVKLKKSENENKR